MKVTPLVALLTILLAISATAQTISFYQAPTYGTGVSPSASVGSTTVTLSQSSAIQIVLDSNYTVMGLNSFLQEVVNVVITDSGNNTVGNFTGQSQQYVQLVGTAYGLTVVSGTTPTEPAGTYTITINLSTTAHGSPTFTANFDTTIIATQQVNPAVQSAIDAATAAFQAGQSSLANQIASLVNTVTALQTQLGDQQNQLGTLQTEVSTLSSSSNSSPSGSNPSTTPTTIITGNTTPTDTSELQSELASLRTQLNNLTDQTNSELSDLRSQVGQKQNQLSFLNLYGPALGAGAVGVGGSLFLEQLIFPPDSHSDTSSTPDSKAKPGFYDK